MDQLACSCSGRELLFFARPTARPLIINWWINKIFLAVGWRINKIFLAVGWRINAIFLIAD